MARDDAAEGLNVCIDERMVVGQLTRCEDTQANLTEIGKRVLVIRTDGGGDGGGFEGRGMAADEGLVASRGKRVVGVCVRESAPAIVS